MNSKIVDDIARRITVNLAPADLPKESGRFDLPIALGILAASEQMPADQLDLYEFAGELSLSGELRPIRGALAMTYAIHRQARSEQPRAFILPEDNADEAALVSNAVIYPARSLLQVVAHFSAKDEDAKLARHQPGAETPRPVYPDLAEVKGQAGAKRALEIAAAGGHSLLMMGPPGTGKSMLAARLPGILPTMTEEEALESAAVQSLTRGFSAEQWKRRPYRAPHHTASSAALVGGGSTPKPGEISLAHGGALFLDELPEFDRHVLEVLREPLESGRITISRAARQADFPARFQLIAAMNPCPCGYAGHPSGKCRCTPDAIQRYQGKLSGPLLDRIDLYVQVNALHPDELIRQPPGEASEKVASRVECAHQQQHERQGKSNQRLTVSEIERHCVPDERGEQLLRQAMSRMNWSARAYHRVLKVARTIADLDGKVRISSLHVGEAIQYRRGLQHSAQ